MSILNVLIFIIIIFLGTWFDDAITKIRNSLQEVNNKLDSLDRYMVFNEEDLHDHEAIGAVIRNKNGKLLMLHHKKYNFWTIPIGKVKNGQTILEGLKMEVLEECDINVINCSEVCSFIKKYKRYDRYVTINTHVFEIEKYDGIGINAEPDKHFELKWLDINEIIDLNISDATKEYLDKIQNINIYKKH